MENEGTGTGESDVDVLPCLNEHTPLCTDVQKLVWSFLRLPKTFDEMGLDKDVLRGVYAYGFEQPSAIQRRAMMPMIAGNSSIVQAQSGTGKTATFGVVCIQRVDPSKPVVQALVLVPTRELGQGVNHMIRQLSKFTRVRSHVCTGGRPTLVIRDDIAVLHAGGIHIIVGTPGRVLQLLQRGVLGVDHLRVTVVDEADEMLARGFRPSLDEIFTFLPKNTQTCSFSATVPREVEELMLGVVPTPVRICWRQDTMTLDGARQFYIDVEKEEWKFETLLDLFEVLPIATLLIFVNTRRKAVWLAEEGTKQALNPMCMHGDMTKDERELVLKALRSGKCRCLITTDLMMAEIDTVFGVTLNYDFPYNPESYLARVGRRGRYGWKRTVINFVTKADVKRVRDTELYFSTTISELPYDFDLL